MKKDLQVQQDQQMQQADDIESAFNTMQNTTDITEVLKELFNDKKIPLITDLSQDEIALITKIDTVSELKYMTDWKRATDKFMTLKLSKNRQSRKEIIDAVRSLGGADQRQGGSNLNPMNWFRR